MCCLFEARYEHCVDMDGGVQNIAEIENDFIKQSVHLVKYSQLIQSYTSLF